MRTKNICEVPVAETAPEANLLAEVGGELKRVPASQYPLKRADAAGVSGALSKCVLKEAEW